jgi:hypothetical protein
MPTPRTSSKEKHTDMVDAVGILDLENSVGFIDLL